MYVVPPSPSAISLFNRAGLVRVFSSKAEALRELGYPWICSHVGLEFRTFSHLERYCDSSHADAVYRVHDFILRDEHGVALGADAFYELHRANRNAWRYSRYSTWNGTGPVPGVSKRGRGRFFRRLSTVAERRTSQHVREEGEPAPRPSRNATSLPSSWDDFARCIMRSWKKSRKTQWKD